MTEWKFYKLNISGSIDLKVRVGLAHLCDLMRSHHRQAAILAPDDKLECYGLLKKKFGSFKMVKLLSGTSTAT